MQEKYDIEEAWPELFVHLTAAQRKAVRQALAAGWHEGFTPSREDAENLTDYARGAIDFDEYQRRAHAAALRETTAMSFGR